MFKKRMSVITRVYSVRVYHVCLISTAEKAAGDIDRGNRSHSGGVQCTRMITLPFIIFESLPFVVFSHQYLHRFQICNHFSHQFSLPKDLLKLNYSALLCIHSSHKQTQSAGDGHVKMALVRTNIDKMCVTNS
jgi:hypothetical protein